MSVKPDAVIGEVNQGSRSACPVVHSMHPTGSSMNQVWWPNRLNLAVLRKRSPASDPMGADFDYAAEFNSLDLPPSRATSQSC